MKQIDILVPCYNEEAVLPQFYQRTCAVIDALPDYAFTFIFVNDGSRDQTLPILRQLHEKDKRVAYVSLSRNFGVVHAGRHGLRRRRRPGHHGR